ncbi:hypothetical protein Hanom_Chr12g01163191 [Helianthus anomalus]
MNCPGMTELQHCSIHTPGERKIYIYIYILTKFVNSSNKTRKSWVAFPKKTNTHIPIDGFKQTSYFKKQLIIYKKKRTKLLTNAQHQDHDQETRLSLRDREAS